MILVTVMGTVQYGRLEKPFPQAKPFAQTVRKTGSPHPLSSRFEHALTILAQIPPRCNVTTASRGVCSRNRRFSVTFHVPRPVRGRARLSPLSAVFFMADAALHFISYRVISLLTQRPAPLDLMCAAFSHSEILTRPPHAHVFRNHSVSLFSARIHKAMPTS